LEAHGETKVNDLEGRALGCVGIQEVFRLEIPVHDTILMAVLRRKVVMYRILAHQVDNLVLHALG
jgi:hypothetical protein